MVISRPVVLRAPWRLVLPALILCAAAWPGAPLEAAQKPLPPDLTKLSIEELMQIDVVYGASRHEQKVTQAPSSITIITADEIRRYGYHTLGDMLKSVRGFWVRDDRNYTYIGVRGFGRLGDYNSRILMLLDDHRVNEDIYDSASAGTEQEFDMEMIDRVEIIRGPGSSLYGTHALLAVINVITKRGGALDGCEVSASYGSYGTQEERAACGRKLHRGGDWLVSASRYVSEGQDLYYKEFDDPATNNGVAEDRDGDRYYRLLANLRFGRFSIQAVHSSREKVVPTASFGTMFNESRERTTDTRTWLDVAWERPLGGKVDFTQRIYYDDTNYSGVYPTDYPPRALNVDSTWSRWAGIETRLVARPSAKHVLSAAVEYRNHLHQVLRNYDEHPYVEYLDETHNAWDGGIYMQEEYSPTKNLTINLGLRRDHYSSFGGTTNPRVAVIYSPAQQTTLKLLYGHAFRAPNAYEIIYPAGSSGFEVGPALSPETLRGTEIVVEQYIGGQIRLTGAIYSDRASNLISLREDPSNGRLYFANTDEMTSKGIELEMERKWSRGFQIRLSHTWQKSSDDMRHNNAVNSPRTLSKLNFGFPVARELLSGGLDAQCESSRRTLAGGRAAGFCLANLTLLSRELAKGLEISASAYNLFDKRYSEPGSDEFLQDQIGQNGRNFRLKVGWRF